MGSLCSGLQSAFSPTQTTSGTTTGTQSGSSTGSTVGTTDSASINRPTFQADVGQALTGLGASYAPATQALSSAASGSTFTPTSYQPWMQQYGDQVQKSLLDYQGLQKKQDLSNLAGSQAMRGAFGNQTGAQAAYLTGRAPGDALAASQVALQGFNQANDNAYRAGQFQTGAAGALAGAASSQAGNVAQLVGAGGGQQSATGQTTGLTNNNFTGQTAGTTQGSTTQTPGIGSVLSGLGGLALSAFSDERVKENIKPVGKLDDGQIIYKYNMLGSPKTEIGLLAQEVEGHKPEAVGMLSGIKTVNYDKATEDAERTRKADGGGITPYKGAEGSPASGSMLEKVLHATHHLKKMRDGGTAQPPMKSRFDDGGAVPFGAWDQPSPTGSEADVGVGDPNGWGATVERAPQGPSFTDKMGAGLTGLSKMGQFQGSPSASGGQSDPYGLNALGTKLQGIVPRFDDGGAVPERGPLSAITDALGSIPKPFSTGVWAGKEATPMQRAGAALTQVGGGWNGAPGPFAGVGSHILEQQNMRYKEMAAERAAAELLGQFQGRPTMTAQQATGAINGVPTLAAKQLGLQAAKNPAEIANLEAHSEPAQIRIKAIEQANQLHQQRLKSIDDMEFVDPSPATNAQYYQQQRAAAEVAHEAALRRLQGEGASQPKQASPGVKTWSPNLPNGGL